jgi:hypothetical protein
MITFLRRRLAGRASSVAAVVVLLVLVLPLVLLAGVFGGGRASSSGGVMKLIGPGAGVTDAQFRSLRLGTSPDDVAHRIGRGQSALEYGATGVALGPIDATCTYYPQAGANRLTQDMQLCYRDEALVSKRMFSAPRPS